MKEDAVGQRADGIPSAAFGPNVGVWAHTE